MTETLWPAPVATTPVDATVTIPGSKSVTNRALVLAALADGPGWVRRPLRSRDSQLMADGLRALGVTIEEQVNNDTGGTGGGEAWRVIPAPALRGPAWSTSATPARSCASCPRSPSSPTARSTSTATRAATSAPSTA